MKSQYRITPPSIILIVGAIVSILLPIITSCDNRAGRSEAAASDTPGEKAAVTESTTYPTPAPTPTPARSSEPVPGPVQAAIERATQDFKVQPDKIQVSSFTETQWFSTALGCPDPDRSYAQVVSPGFIVKLEVGGRSVTYHTNLASTVIRCQAD